MIVTIKNQNFSDIYEVRLYRQENEEADSILRKVGTFGLSDSDFIETDFTYTQNKLEFSSPSLLDELVDQDKETMESEGVGNLEKYYLTLFPTIVFPDSSSDDNITYFSSNLDSTGTETMCILIPEDIGWAKMYDIAGDLAIEIQFGINEEGVVNKELDCSKALTMMTTYSEPKEEKGEKIPFNINLSWMAYEDDKNPVRRMSEYVLRNDSFSENWKGYQEKYGYLFSNLSNSLVGTEKIEERPIYDLLKGFSASGGKWWNRSKRYSIGDRVVIGDIEYESLSPNNIGNHPYYSGMWVKAQETC